MHKMNKMGLNSGGARGGRNDNGAGLEGPGIDRSQQILQKTINDTLSPNMQRRISRNKMQKNTYDVISINYVQKVADGYAEIWAKQ